MKPFPPVLLAIGMLLVYLLGQAAQAGNLGPLFDDLRLHLAGWALLAFGVCGVVGLIFKFRKNETTVLPDGTPTNLMTDGIYAYSRNPIYVLMGIALFGVVLINGAWIGLTVLPVFLALVNVLWIRFEEAQLEAQFGQAYLEYKARVRKWI
ncbi:MAG: methyltransferase family protein [Parvibaculales bacterium]